MRRGRLGLQPRDAGFALGSQELRELIEAELGQEVVLQVVPLDRVLFFLQPRQGDGACPYWLTGKWATSGLRVSDRFPLN